MKLDYSGMQKKPVLAHRLKILTKLRRLLRRSNPPPQKEYDLVAIVQKRLAQNQAKHQHPRTQEGIDKCRF